MLNPQGAVKSFNFEDFLNRFPTDDACLEEIKKKRFPHGIHCKKCRKKRKFYKVKGRKAYGCRICRWQSYPLKGTIFERSSTSLRKWFYAMYLMSQTRAGVPAKQLQRQLGVTYKCAWRMGHKIRELMHERPKNLLGGIVEIDETYWGGSEWENRRKYGFASSQKEPIMGIVQRRGPAYLFHLKYGVGARSLIEPIQEHISQKAFVMTDQLAGYKQLIKKGYRHYSVKHQKEFKRGAIYTQNVENVWSHLKRGIHGSYRSVSRTHLQKYADEYAFRYSHRKCNGKMFEELFKRI